MDIADGLHGEYGVVVFSLALGAVLIKEGQRKFKPHKITLHTDASKIHAL